MTTPQLHQRIQELEAQVAQLQARNNFLEEQFRLAQHKAFGRSSETYPGQGELFNEPEQLVEEAEAEPEQQEITYTRNRPKREPLPKDLPRERVVIDLPEDEKICGCCQGELHQIGEDTSEKLEFIPAQVKVIETVRPKYACRACDKAGTENTIKQQPAPQAIIPKSIATPSLLAQIITSKYQYGLPLYRQEALFKQYGIELSRKTMSDWMVKSAAACEPIWLRLKQLLLAQPVLHADETRLRVLNDDKSISYMWVYCCGTDSPGDGPPNIVLFDYQQGSRAGHCPKQFLQDYQGYLQVDGYEAYTQTNATLIGCMAHARRKFDEAAKAVPKGKTGKPQWAINHIKKLYRIETLHKDSTPEQRYAARQQQAKPLLEDFKTWLDKTAIHTPPKSKLGIAIAYCLNQWPKLTRYIEDGRLSIDNNRAERAVRPFAVGRKNWLFANTHTGADASAMLYSLVETAKANGLTPFDYLHYLFKELPKLKPGDDLDHLLPWNFAKS